MERRAGAAAARANPAVAAKRVHRDHPHPRRRNSRDVRHRHRGKRLGAPSAAVVAPTLPRLTQGVLAALAARFGFLFLAVGAPGLFDTIIKRLIGRARPYVGSYDDPFAYIPFSWRSDYASMPSGHSANVAAAAIAIGALWPKMRPAMWLFALLIMFSRVVVLAHHPSDVIVGALVGAVGAVLVRRWFAARRLVFSAQELKAFPGASLQRAASAARQILFGS